MRKLFSFHGGIVLEGHKQMSLQHPIITAEIPKQLVHALHQHIGEAAYPIVEVGDHVLTGQMIAQAEGFVSAPVHAGSSGTVVAIEDRPVAHPSGIKGQCIVIETDGKDQWINMGDEIEDYKRMDASHLRNLVRDAGIVGLGGAGFPAFIKLNPGKNSSINTLILNGAECEPYISCDAALLVERPREIIDGFMVIRHALQARQCLIGIEDNKPEAINALKTALTSQEKTIIDVVTIPTKYPAGSEKQLIKTLTGVSLAAKQLPIHHGIVCHNVGTAAAVGHALRNNRPLISRTVTVTGDAIDKPGNYDVRLGTPMINLLQQAELQSYKMERLVMGGPMMGFEINDLNSPVLKTTNCLLTVSEEQLPQNAHAMPCIRCGECNHVCPANLLPQQLYWHARARDLEKVQNYNLFDCIECGCCTYVCPSHIPLVQYFRFAKTEIWAQELERKKSDHARERHEFNQYRAERKKLEKEEARRKKQAQLKNSDQNEVAAALARVSAKKAEKANENKNETQQEKG
ncbi:Electron transport complex protein RnfC [hydrothermal vent metagenome]|uniref:Electron transport complex protein RnfC n=1 Tax=hydrothermal vent metagenome TaxID=652676 RepID=A0A3B0ZQV6_9ZZZZ